MPRQARPVRGFQGDRTVLGGGGAPGRTSRATKGDPRKWGNGSPASAAASARLGQYGDRRAANGSVGGRDGVSGDGESPWWMSNERQVARCVCVCGGEARQGGV